MPSRDTTPKPAWMGIRPPTEQEKQDYYGCSYCCAVGACPRCWGRAGIDALSEDNAAMKAALEKALRRLEQEEPKGMDEVPWAETEWVRAALARTEGR